MIPIDDTVHNYTANMMPHRHTDMTTKLNWHDIGMANQTGTDNIQLLYRSEDKASD